jgi:IPT/TIG domain
MLRNVKSMVVASLLISLGAVGFAPAADAATRTSLVLSQSAAFAVIKYDCGGIKERVYATGFASNGYPAGVEHLETTCSSGGRGGGHFTVAGWASSVWTWYGVTRSFAKLEKEPEGLSTTFKAEDSYGDKIFNEGTSVFLETTTPPVKAPAAPTNVTAAAYRTGEEGEAGPQNFNVTWTPDPENQGLITSSTVTATPVGSTAPVLMATVNGGANIAQVGTLETTTTYKIVVTSTDQEGTSQPSEPIEATSLTKEEGEAPVAPIVGTQPAEGVTQASATLTGYVNPNGEEVTACYFEYGTSESYGESVACSSLPGEGETPVIVSAPVAGLTPLTTYHFRVVAASAGGTSYGADLTFTTTSTGAPPTVKKLSPKTGPKAGGTLVTITGTGLAGATVVKFGSTEAAVVSDTNTSITAESPAGTGTVDVIVATPNGESAITSKDRFKYKKR